ncbi:MAG TPA: DUF4388 domain-containing protein [Anaerolineae bacterium]|nr:DUF4388 domain-containing protein [Anaerolineae bacterium]
MALKGDLSNFSTAQLLNLISLARKTGTLSIDGEDMARMSFREGKLIYATLGSDSENSLAHILQRGGKLSQQQTKAIEKRAAGTGDKQLGHLLIQAGYVTQSDIIQSMRKHILDVAYKIFTWAEGLFRFEANKLPPPDRITIPIDLDSVILEGSRRLKEWEHLQDELPSLDICLKFPDQPSTRLNKINLTVEEWKVISFIDPKNNMRQIAKANNLNDFQIRRIVYSLLQAGLVEIASQPRAVKKPPPTRSQKARAEREAQKSPDVKRTIVNRLIDRIRRI